MEFTKPFWVSLGIMIVLFFIPFLLTMNAPMVDGQASGGFPFVFASYGGRPIPGATSVTFSAGLLFADLIILIGVPFLVNAIYVRWIKKL